jgi:hypothetical protein
MGASRAGLLDRAECQRLLDYADYGVVASYHGLNFGYGRATTMCRLLGPAVRHNLPRGAGEQWNTTVDVCSSCVSC